MRSSTGAPPLFETNPDYSNSIKHPHPRAQQQLCPINYGIKVLAWSVQLTNVDELLAELAKPSSTIKANVEKVMQFMVHPNEILTKAAIPAEKSTWDTLFGGSEKLKVEKDVDEDSGAVKSVTVYANEDEGIRGFDLFFNKTYAPGDPYIVHAIGYPLIPDDVNIELDDDHPPEGSDDPITFVEIADCKRVLEAVEVPYEGATLVSVVCGCGSGCVWRSVCFPGCILMQETITIPFTSKTTLSFTPSSAR